MIVLPRLKLARVLALATALVLGACATTHYEETGGPDPAAAGNLCQRPGEGLTALVLWGPRWRPDQKEPDKRTAAAQAGLQRFFSTPECFSRTRLLRGTDTDQALALAPAQIRALSQQAPAAHKVLRIAVRELGPVLRIGTPSVVEGGTEVVLDIERLSPATGHAEGGSLHAHWRHGGAFVIKGVGTLEDDMVSALRAALRPQVPAMPARTP